MAFSLMLTVASRLLHQYNTNEKTSRLMVKSFSERFTELHGEEKREEGERGERKEEEGESKGARAI